MSRLPRHSFNDRHASRKMFLFSHFYTCAVRRVGHLCSAVTSFHPSFTQLAVRLSALYRLWLLLRAESGIVIVMAPALGRREQRVGGGGLSILWMETAGRLSVCWWRGAERPSVWRSVPLSGSEILWLQNLLCQYKLCRQQTRFKASRKTRIFFSPLCLYVLSGCKCTNLLNSCVFCASQQ